jgi:hypothetical protein
MWTTLHVGLRRLTSHVDQDDHAAPELSDGLPRGRQSGDLTLGCVGGA